MYNETVRLWPGATVASDVLMRGGEPTAADAYLRPAPGPDPDDVFLFRQRYDTLSTADAPPPDPDPNVFGGEYHIIFRRRGRRA